MMDETVEDFEAVYGQARGEIMGKAGVSTHLPFLFSLLPMDFLHLRLCVSDFHDQTWRSDFSVTQLQDLRDEVGIGGSWSEFLAYLKAALVSENVKLVFAGPASGVDGHGATSGSLVAQRAKGTPRLVLSLTKLEGSHVHEAMGSIAVGLFRAYHAQSFVLASEKTRTSVLETSLAAEKAKVEKLQEASGLSYAGRKKSHRDRSAELFSTPSSSQFSSMPLTQETHETQELVAPTFTPPKGIVEQSKDVPIGKPSGPRSKVHVAPASRRAKRRGTAISEQPD